MGGGYTWQLRYSDDVKEIYLKGGDRKFLNMTRKILRWAVNNSINGVFDVTYSVVCDTY